MRQKGVLQISNPTANVTFSISGLAVYTITPTLTNCTAQAGNPTTIEQGGTAQLTFLFDGTNYKCPTTAPTVTGATGTWVKVSDTKGNLTLSNPSGAVSFSVVGEQAQWSGTDLTGTTWRLNQTIPITWQTSAYSPGYVTEQYLIDISYTSLDGSNISRSYLAFCGRYHSKIGSIPAHNSYRLGCGTYADETYCWGYINSDSPITNIGTYYNKGLSSTRIFSITGGTDVTNSTLIAWLRANATLISW